MHTGKKYIWKETKFPAWVVLGKGSTSTPFKLFTALMYYFHNLKTPNPRAYTTDSDSVRHVSFLNASHVVLLSYQHRDPLGTLEGWRQGRFSNVCPWTAHPWKPKNKGKSNGVGEKRKKGNPRAKRCEVSWKKRKVNKIKQNMTLIPKSCSKSPPTIPRQR